MHNMHKGRLFLFFPLELLMLALSQTREMRSQQSAQYLDEKQTELKHFLFQSDVDTDC